MSNMLEQAIIDASQLREAALRSAEATVVEKYSSEVKETVSRLLEQEPEEELGLDTEPDPENDSEVVKDIPFAHDPDVDEDEVVVLDLDQIIAAADADEGEEDESFELDIEDVADQVGIPLDPDSSAAEPGNRQDSGEEIDINEGDLLDLFKELLVVDIDTEKIQSEEKSSESSKEEDGEEIVVSSRTDGFDAEDINDHAATSARLELEMESLKKENTNLKNILDQAKDRLQEINLSNARLLYANRVLQDSSLNEQQKNKIANMISETRTVDEAKMVYETLQKTLASNVSKQAPQSLSEAVSRRSSVILGAQRQTNPDKSDPVKSRWATLAGISDKN